MAKLLMAANPAKLLPTTAAPAKISIPPTTATTTNAPSFLRLRLPQLKPAFLSLTTALTTTLTLAAPSLAEMEKASLFDFNLTLPIIAGEFLLLMVTLDKIYFSPLGKFMDERDAEIREKLASVKDSSEEVKQMEDQAAAIMKAARAEIAAALNQMKKEVSAEVEQMLAEGQARVEAELKVALEALEKQKEATILSLDSQIADLSQEIVKKVLPL